MATLKDAIAERRRARRTANAAPLESLFKLPSLAGVIEELISLRARVEEAIAASKAAYKGDKGEPGRDADPVDEAALAKRIEARIRVPRDGIDAPPVDEHEVALRVLKMLPPPEKGDKGDAAVLDHEELAGQMVEKLKGKLTVEHVGGIGDMMDAYWKRIQRQFGAASSVIKGGGDTVAAGTNVTITRLANGQRQISATGGFTALAATETPDGSLTVFTFPDATAEPSYIRADNTLVKATSKSGTVNWTWDSGAKQVTMTVAPQDDIEAIA